MSWILTSNGKAFDLFTPQAKMISSVDIAHALAHTCRFNGHCHQFYSVAQHCLIVSEIVPPEHKLVALLHDATEAYVGDMVRPLKQLMFEQGHTLYAEVEHRVWLAICEHFHLEPELPESVKEADMIALATERRDLMPDHPAAWDCLRGITPLNRSIPEWSPRHARQVYHDRLLELLATTHRARVFAQAEHELIHGTSTGSPAGLSQQAGGAKE